MSLPPFAEPVPADLHQWNARRVQLRSRLYATLGDMPPIFTPQPKVSSVEQRDGYRLERFTYKNGLDDTVFGYTLVPKNPTGAAVLYCHWHGGQYHLGKDEPFVTADGSVWIGQTPRVVSLAQAGYLVVIIDCYAFGERQHQGPAGEREDGRETEQSLFKRFLWEGRTLWGMIVYDDLLALNYLLSRPDVDPNRVAVTGASLGGSRTTWLAALDDRIKVAAPVIQYTRYQNLILTGDLNRHSIYYYVPGILKAGLDMEAIVGLVAPRPQIVLVGGADPLSPPEGIRMINEFASAVYRLYGAEDHFQPHVYPGQGHAYTPDMFERLLEFLKVHLSA